MSSRLRPRHLGATVLGILLLSAGLLVGLGAGAASPDGAETATGTSATVPEPVVTAVARPTHPDTVLPGTGRPTILLGNMNLPPEQSIIGQLYELALEHEGYSVNPISHNLGTPHDRIAAIQNESLDIYPEYLGVWNSAVAHEHRRFRTLRASYAAARKYATRHGYVLLPPTPFSDTSCVAVLSQYAAANHIRSIPQLARRGPVIFGAALNFQTHADGLPALEQSYHFDPGYVQPIGFGLQYSWLRTGNVDAANCVTTDPALDGPKYVQLTDPNRVFGHGNVIPVTTEQVIQAEGPAFAATIRRVDRLLTQRAIRGLNAELEHGGHDQPQIATQIAKQFLQGNGILPRSRYAPVPTVTSTTPTSTGT